jgi:chromosome segregation ATPase
MKLKAFNKKSNGYLARIQKEHQQLLEERDEQAFALDELEGELEQKRRLLHNLEERSSPYSSSEIESQTRLAVSEMANRVLDYRSALTELDREIAQRAHIAFAPDHYAAAKKALEALQAETLATEKAKQQTQAQLAKVEKRMADLQARIERETESATANLLAADEEFETPAKLTQLEVDLRLATNAHVQLSKQLNEMVERLLQIPQEACLVRIEFRAYRATVAEIELYEQLQAVMPALARASVCRHDNDRRHRVNHFEIEIPNTLIESAQKQLVTELADAAEED